MSDREIHRKKEWREVICRRTAEMKNGKLSGKSMEQVLKEIRARLDRSRNAA